MDSSKQLLPDLAGGDEKEQLAELYAECEAFLRQWDKYIYHSTDNPVDAYIAISELQRDIVARLGYLEATIHQTKLPF